MLEAVMSHMRFDTLTDRDSSRARINYRGRAHDDAALELKRLICAAEY